jgi:hypothetical protein
VLEELLWRQIARLPSIEDRLGDIRREIAEADEAREVRPREASIKVTAATAPPSIPAADLGESVSSSISPIAIRMTLTALPITSAGRFSPRGPRGMFYRRGNL